MKRRIAAILVMAAASLSVLAACAQLQDHDVVPNKAPHAPVSMPSDMASVEASPLTASLESYGYKLVGENVEGKKPVGYIYVHCAAHVSIADCGSNRHNNVPLQYPNIYTEGDKVTRLEGPHDAKIDHASYRCTVPAAYQDFANLSPNQQKKLLGVMREVENRLNTPTNPTAKYHWNASIGRITAWVQVGD